MSPEALAKIIETTTTNAVATTNPFHDMPLSATGCLSSAESSRTSPVLHKSSTDHRPTRWLITSMWIHAPEGTDSRQPPRTANVAISAIAPIAPSA